MKKYFGVLFASTAIVLFSVFISSYQEAIENNDDKIEYQEVSDFLWENVYPQLDVLAPNDLKKSFSRCPSGFSQSLDEKQTGNVYAYGTIYNAEGCSREEFCEYKVNMNEKTAELRNLGEKEYLAMDEYIAIEKEKLTAKF